MIYQRMLHFTKFLIGFSALIGSIHAGPLQSLTNNPQVRATFEHNANLKKEYQYQLAIAAIFRGEARFLKEWIEYHKLLGVEHFYLYNNLSEDHYLEVLQPYIERNEVELIEWPYESNGNSDYDVIQCNAYSDALQRTTEIVKWLAIIDLDEFLVPVKDKDLLELLKRYENTPEVGGVCGIWIFFGTSYVEEIPEDKLMIELLLLNGDKIYENFWQAGAYKSIIRPDRVSSIPSPHYSFYRSGYKHVGVPYELLQINHYWTRDEKFFREVKIPRRIKWGYSPECSSSWCQGANQNHPHHEIQKFVAPLRKRMGYSSE